MGYGYFGQNPWSKFSLISDIRTNHISINPNLSFTSPKKSFRHQAKYHTSTKSNSKFLKPYPNIQPKYPSSFQNRETLYQHPSNCRQHYMIGEKKGIVAYCDNMKNEEIILILDLNMSFDF